MPSSKIFDLVQIVRANFFKNRKKNVLIQWITNDWRIM